MAAGAGGSIGGTERYTTKYRNIVERIVVCAYGWFSVEEQKWLDGCQEALIHAGARGATVAFFPSSSPIH